VVKRYVEKYGVLLCDAVQSSKVYVYFQGTCYPRVCGKLLTKYIATVCTQLNWFNFVKNAFEVSNS